MKRVRKLVDQSVDGIVVVGVDGTVRFANASAATLLGLEADAMIGFPLGYPTVGEGSVELVVAPGSRQPRIVELRAVEIEWEGETAQLVNLRDVTTQREQQRRIQTLKLDPTDPGGGARSHRMGEGSGRPAARGVSAPGPTARLRDRLRHRRPARRHRPDPLARRCSERGCRPHPRERHQPLGRRRSHRGRPRDVGPADRHPVGRPCRRPRGDRAAAAAGRGFWGSALRSMAVAAGHRRAEARLHDSENRFRQLFEHSSDAILIADQHGRYLQVNEAACSMLGYSRAELLNMTVADLTVPEDAPDPKTQYECYTTVGQQRGLFEFVRSDGARRVAEYSAFMLSPGLFVSILRDVTERLSLEDQLRHAQKMEAVGRLAGGIAHDFNNILTAIIDFAGFVRDETPDGDPRREDIGQVLRAADRASGLTRQLLAFSRRQPISPKSVDLNQLLSDVERLLQRTLGEDIEVTRAPGPDLWPVFIDPGQFEQVVMNSAVNARDAMPDGGALRFETRNAEDGALGPCVVLEVTDSGCGMSEAFGARVFEPFFTTKEVDKGTGLGLSTVYGLVTQAGGDVSVRSTLNEGTTFEIRLPRHDATIEAQQAPPPSAASDLAGTEWILVVEDDSTIRRVVTRILSSYGYGVISAASGTEAQTLLSDPRVHVNLVVCDLVMPQLSGRQTAEALRALRPGLRVLFMTGYPADVIDRGGVLDPSVEVIFKPFSATGLATRVRHLLASQETSPVGGAPALTTSPAP